MTLWARRMGAAPARELMAFSRSISFDQRLGADDVEGSRAHVRGLAHVGLLDAAEEQALVGALDRVGEEIGAGAFVFSPDDEDIHSAIERRVTELCGPTGAKLHTGRSRNDQVATALRLYVRRELVRVARAVVELAAVLAARASDAGESYLPGYTHLQRAQPVLVAHHLLAHAWALERDVDRILSTRDRLDVSPLGAGALGGSSLGIDPQFTADALGFAAAFENSIDAVSDRDFVAETLFCVALVGVHLSRLGEEVVLYASEEFGFYRLDDAYATGSSMLPQKKNPDIAELARGKSGRLIGHLTGFLATLKGLPLAYNRDLQEDKEPLFDALDQILVALDAMRGLYATVGFETEVMQRAADGGGIGAIDLAEWLVARGTPFREAHGVVGDLVRRSLAEDSDLAELVADTPAFGTAAAAVLAPGISVKVRSSRGGGGVAAVAAQLERFTARLAATRERLESIAPTP